MNLFEDMIPQELRDLILLCCDFDPTSRLSVAQVEARVQVMLTKVKHQSKVPIVERSMAQHQSTRKLKEDIVALLKAQAAQIDQMKAEMKEGFNRMQSGFDKLSNQNQKALTTLLNIANDKLQYPPIVLVLPVPKKKKTISSKFFNMFSTSDTFMVVFICERTWSYIPYGNDVEGGYGLKFTLLKPTLGKIAVSIRKFMNDFGPILKLSAMTLSTVITLASGLHINQLLPSSLFTTDNVESMEFISSYCDQLAQLGSETQNGWDNIKQAEMGRGLSEMSESTLSKLAPFTHDAYFRFLSFLTNHKYDRRQLQGEVMAGDDGLMHWTKYERFRGRGQGNPIVNPLTNHSNSTGKHSRAAAVDEEDSAHHQLRDQNSSIVDPSSFILSSPVDDIIPSTGVVLWSGSAERTDTDYMLGNKVKIKFIEVHSDGIYCYDPNNLKVVTSLVEINSMSSVTLNTNGTMTLISSKVTKKYFSSKNSHIKFKFLEKSKAMSCKHAVLDIIERHQVKLKEPFVNARIENLVAFMDSETSLSILESLSNEIHAEFPVLHEYSKVEMKLKNALYTPAKN